MKILIVDDEPLARKRLVRLLGQQPGYQVVAQAGNGEQAIAACANYHPDVVLMDIRMPVMDGLAAASALAAMAQPPAVIFCTAYDDYALQAFNAKAVDYLLKPVNRDKLTAALDRAQQLTRLQISALHADQREHISARTSRGVELIPLEAIRYCLADQKYVSVYYLRDGQLQEQLLDDPLKVLEEDFGEHFVRIHRNALVATRHIQGLQKCAGGIRLQLAGVVEGPLVSRRHLSAVRLLLQQL
jgi:two-component system response regulator AlgR